MLLTPEEMAAFSVNGAGETGRPRTEGLNLTPISHPLQKSVQNESKT